MSLWESSKNYILGLGLKYDNLSSQCDGVTKLFTVSLGNYVSGKLSVYLNGVRIFDFTETDPTTGKFTMDEAPQLDESGIKFYADYHHI